MDEGKKITQADIDHAEVKLKAVAGIQPRSYVVFLYGTALVLLAYLTLFHPGLRRRGITYSFEADPPASAVYIDGAYKGYTPCDIFLPAGEHTLRIERPGFVSAQSRLHTGGRIFATLIARPRAAHHVVLEAADTEEALRSAMRRYAAWALAGTPSEAYQIPMELSETARAITPPAFDVSGIAGAALSYAAHAVSGRDALRATALLYGASPAIQPVALGALTDRIVKDLSDDPHILAACMRFVPDQTRAKIESTALYKRLDQGAAIKNGAPLTIGGKRFVPFTRGENTEASWYMAAAETTVGEFKRFAAAAPEWAQSSAVYESDDEPVRYVSYRAAEAYCAWLSQSAPKGWRYALPSDAQWQSAARASGTSAQGLLFDGASEGPVPPARLAADKAGFYGLLGNVWEWCGGSYTAFPYCGEKGRARFPSDEGLVRGGSWANRAELTDIQARGAVKKDEFSPYTGFRVALVREP